MPSRLLRSIRMCLLIVLGIASHQALADPAPQTMVRAHLEPAGPVVAGSEVKLVVDVLTTTFFTDAPDWPLFNVPGAVVSLPDEQATNLSETMDGVKWFGVSRIYRIAAQGATANKIPSFAITLHPGGMDEPVKVMTPALTLVTTMPAGAIGMKSFFPTPKLVVTQKIEPSQGRIRVGDSVTRTIVQTATGTESMLIPPASFSDVDGLRRYAQSPTTHDVIQDRAGLVAGERNDQSTYVVERAGKFKLPPETIEWWNTSTQKREVVELPPVSFSAVAVSEKPVFAIPLDRIVGEGRHRIIAIDSRQLLVGACVAAIGLVTWWLYPRLVKCYGRARHTARVLRERYTEGEWPTWRKLRGLARHGTLPQVVPALYAWMDRSGDFAHPSRLEDLVELGSNSADVVALLDAVNTHYAKHDEAPLDEAGHDDLDHDRAPHDKVSEKKAPQDKVSHGKLGRDKSPPPWRTALTVLRSMARRARKHRTRAPALGPLNLSETRTRSLHRK